jgi:hypothetical protein
MKKVYLFIAMLLIASVTMAQLMPKDNAGFSLKSTKSMKITPGSGIKAIIDTIGWTAASMPCFGSPTNTVSVYGMVEGTPQVHIGYWFGTSGDINPDSLEADYWAQCWVNSANVKVAGVLFFAAGKAVMVGGASSNVTMGVQKMDATSAVVSYPPLVEGPGPDNTYLASGTMNIADVDTNFLTFNYVPFTTMATLAGVDFCAVADFKAMRVNGDTCYMMCDASGNGLGLNYSQMCTSPGAYYWVAMPVNSADFDVNISMFALIDDGAGIADEGFFQGMKMTIRNNPAKENIFVDYALQYTSPVKIYIYDITGKEVMVINQGNQAAGTVHTATINTCDLRSGNYLVSIEANGGRFTKKLIVE